MTGDTSRFRGVGPVRLGHRARVDGLVDARLLDLMPRTFVVASTCDDPRIPGAEEGARGVVERDRVRETLLPGPCGDVVTYHDREARWRS